VLYFAATLASNPRIHCVGTATSSKAAGPFSGASTPFACHEDQGGAIDPSGYYDAHTNNRYVVYKIDGNNNGNGGNCNNGVPPIHNTPILLQQVSNLDGITPIGTPVQILDRGEADGPLVEAPSIARLGSKYFVFFSSNCFNSQWYDVSFAVSDRSIYGPYEKRGPLLTTDNSGLFAPGGLEVAADGRHVAFHAGQQGSRLMYWGDLEYHGGTQVRLCISGGDCKEAD
jgi:Glycosyl hydrolases family 43